MSNIVLGDMCRFNFGIINNYKDNTRQEYKTYIVQLNKTMITAVYGTNREACVIERTYDLLQTQEEKEKCLGEEKYFELEEVLKYYCKIHNCTLKICRKETELTVIIDMLNSYDVYYY